MEDQRSQQRENTNVLTSTNPFEIHEAKQGNFLKRRLFRLVQRDEDSGKSNVRAFCSLFVLFLVYVLNQGDRLVLAAVLPDGMRCEVGPGECSNNSNSGNENHANSSCGCIEMSENGQGLLTGPAFTVVYVVAGIPLAWLADRKSRMLVLLIGIFFWSLMVFLTGFVNNYWELLLTRIGLGLGEATCNPVAYSLISDLFLPQNRATALSAYSFGIYLGGGFGYGFSALNKLLCWRWIFRGLGILGAVMALVVIASIRDPGHQKDNTVTSRKPQKSQYTIKETFFFLVKNPPFMILLLAGSIRNLPGYALGGWLATFYGRDLDQSAESYGPTVAVVVAVGGISGACLGGFLSDRLGKMYPEAKAYVIAISQLLAAPAIIGTLLASEPKVSYGILFLAYVTAETWVGCAAAIVQDVCMPSIRGQASAVYIAVITVIGGFGPLVISGFTENSGLALFDKCSMGVRNALLVTVPTFYVVSACCFFVVALALRAERRKMNSDETRYLASDIEENEFNFTSALPDSEA